MSKRPRFLDPAHASESYVMDLKSRIEWANEELQRQRREEEERRRRINEERAKLVELKKDHAAIESNTRELCWRIINTVNRLFELRPSIEDSGFRLEFTRNRRMEWRCKVIANHYHDVIETDQKYYNWGSLRALISSEFHWHVFGHNENRSGQNVWAWLRDPYQQLLAITPRLPSDLVWVVRDYLIGV